MCQSEEQRAHLPNKNDMNKPTMLPQYALHQQPRPLSREEHQTVKLLSIYH